MTDEEAKRQFALFALLRIGGLIVFFLGIAIGFTDLVRPGGWKLLGGVLIALGAFDAMISPRLAKRLMNRPRP